MCGARTDGRCQRGQAAVEFVAVAPLVAIAIVALAHVVLIGHGAWAASQAASAAARAHAVGLDPVAAARAALPAHLDRRARVRTKPDGRVTVSLRLPAVTLNSEAHFEPQQ